MDNRAIRFFGQACRLCAMRISVWKTGRFFCNRQVCGGVFFGKFFVAGFQVMRKNENKVFLQVPESFWFHLNAFFPHWVCGARALDSRAKRIAQAAGGKRAGVKRLCALRSIIFDKRQEAGPPKRRRANCAGKFFCPVFPEKDRAISFARKKSRASGGGEERALDGCARCAILFSTNARRPDRQRGGEQIVRAKFLSGLSCEILILSVSPVFGLFRFLKRRGGRF